MSLELAILGFLSERPRSGYDLKNRCFSGPLGTLWTADQAQIYRTLERLKEAGLVDARRRRQSGRPDRRMFELTHDGAEKLAELLATSAPLPPLRDPFLVQLYFGAGLDDEHLLAVLRHRRSEHQERLELLRLESAELASATEATTRASVMRQTALEGGMAQQAALIDWLDDCIQAVSDGVLPGSSTGIGQRHLFGS